MKKRSENATKLNLYLCTSERDIYYRVHHQFYSQFSLGLNSKQNGSVEMEVSITFACKWMAVNIYVCMVHVFSVCAFHSVICLTMLKSFVGFSLVRLALLHLIICWNISFLKVFAIAVRYTIHTYTHIYILLLLFHFARAE